MNGIINETDKLTTHRSIRATLQERNGKQPQILVSVLLFGDAEPLISGTGSFKIQFHWQDLGEIPEIAHARNSVEYNQAKSYENFHWLISGQPSKIGHSYQIVKIPATQLTPEAFGFLISCTVDELRRIAFSKSVVCRIDVLEFELAQNVREELARVVALIGDVKTLEQKHEIKQKNIPTLSSRNYYAPIKTNKSHGVYFKIFLAVFFIFMIWVINHKPISYSDGNNIHENSLDKEKMNEEFLEKERIRTSCLSDIEIKKSQYKNYLAVKDYDSAARLFVVCAKVLNDPLLKEMYDFAQVKIYIQDIENPKTHPKARAFSMRKLIEEYPDTAKKYDHISSKILAVENEDDESKYTQNFSYYKTYKPSDLREMIAKGSYPEQTTPTAETQEMIFNECVMLVKTSLNEVKDNYPTEIAVESSIVFVAKMWTNDGAIVFTCSQPDSKLLITKSNYK